MYSWNKKISQLSQNFHHFLFDILTEKFKPKNNETIPSLQYCKLSREAVGKRMDWLRIMVAEYKYKETDRQLK